MRPYVQLARLEEIVLEESYVLGVIAEPGELSVDLDFVLTRSHLDYAPPAACEHECFKRGTPNFRQVERLVWEEQGSPPAVDASGERDYGHIDSFEWEDGHYVLAADFGRIDARPDEIEVALTAKA